MREVTPKRSASSRATASSRPPIANTAALVGMSGTSTNPVPKVPTSAPAVAHADRLPTTRPVCSRSCSRSLATTGLTALSTKAGGNRMVSAMPRAANSSVPRAALPNARTSGTAAMHSRPPAPSSSGSSQRPSKRSAARPPAAAPAAIPASAAPMIAVVVSSVRPT